MSQKDLIYVGDKPVMKYVQAIITQIGEGAEEVSVKARGRAINRAADAAEIVRNRFLEKYDIREIKTGTERWYE
ncbi:RNA-binding protein [candidate division MSBL1 archaeon SCGC-AAA261G05]|uniref:RNA-binding protein n=1 Tax=candidate division MSBL1 archaeon SCGC-AAA261G05 TaxID=1698276 RepID=A0A133VA32_9EURY|nr:RNA-binding protein [candidate division MSBL1 archaeon SCGC-AAA261G05]